MRLNDLRRVLTRTGEILKTRTKAVELAWFKDWFFHDEAPTLPKPYSWDEFDRMVATDEAAIRFCVGDDLCTFAILPEDFSWMLHVDVPEEQENSAIWQGQMALTGSLALVQEASKKLLMVDPEFQPASQYFIPSWCR